MKRIQLLVALSLTLMLQTCEPVYAGGKHLNTTAGILAASQVGASQPGDTLYLAANTYRFVFGAGLMCSGTATNRIVVRPEPGASVIIDNGGTGESHYMKGAYWEVRQIRFTNSNINPPLSEGGVNADDTDGLRLIDCDFDNQGGACVNPYRTSGKVLVYGCTFKYYGRASVSGNDYAMYGQNNDGVEKRVEDCVAIGGFGIFTYHMQGSSAAPVNSLSFFNNVSTGHPLYNGKNPIMLFGNYETGAGTNKNNVIVENYLYRSSLELGYHGDGMENTTLTGNIVVAGVINEHPANTYAAKSGNLVVPALDRVIVRPNKYRDRYSTRMATIIVFNSSGASSVSVPLPSGVLSPGQQYRIIDVQNLQGTWTAGTYAGGNLTIAMPNETSPFDQPVSLPAIRQAGSQPAHMENKFNVFLLLGPVGGAVIPPQPVVVVPNGTFDASPLTLDGPGIVRLTWTSTNATTVSISGVGSVALSGQMDVVVTATRTFTLTLGNSAGSANYSRTITVNAIVPPPPPVSLYDAVTVLGVTFQIRKANTDTTIFVPVRIQKGQ